MSSKQLFLINHLTTVLTNYIQSNDALYSHFKHHNQKYSIYDLTYWIIYSSIINISIYKLPKSSINMSHSILYKFNYKLAKLDIFNKFRIYYTQLYLKTIPITERLLYIDSTFILNKLGNEEVAFNPQIKKHKTSKISIICDQFKIPIDVIISNSNTHDVKLAYEHVDNIVANYSNLMNENNKSIADAAYDSIILHAKLKENNLGTLITEINNRNSHEHCSLNAYQKFMLKSRYKIEHINANIKKYNKINVRYDRYFVNFKNTVNMMMCYNLVSKLYNIL